MRTLLHGALGALALSGCSTFHDEVHVTLGDGVRLISVNDRDLVLEAEGGGGDNGASERLLFGGAPGASPGEGGADPAVGFRCTLTQEGSQSALLAALFSPGRKESTASLACYRLTAAERAALIAQAAE